MDKEITQIPETIDSIEQYKELVRSLEKDLKISRELQDQLYARDRMIHNNKSLAFEKARHLCNHTNLEGSTMQRTEGYEPEYTDPEDDYSWECKVCGPWWYAPEKGKHKFTKKVWYN